MRAHWEATRLVIESRTQLVFYAQVVQGASAWLRALLDDPNAPLGTHCCHRGVIHTRPRVDHLFSCHHCKATHDHWRRFAVPNVIGRTPPCPPQNPSNMSSWRQAAPQLPNWLHRQRVVQNVAEIGSDILCCTFSSRLPLCMPRTDAPLIGAAPFRPVHARRSGPRLVMCPAFILFSQFSFSSHAPPTTHALSTQSPPLSPSSNQYYHPAPRLPAHISPHCLPVLGTARAAAPCSARHPPQVV